MFCQAHCNVVFKFNQGMSWFMQVQLRRFACTAFLAGALLFAACAKDKPALVSDPDAKKEGALPWNQQEQWETQGQFQAGSGTDHR